MTGYGNAEKLTEKFNIKVEIKSLNGKFLELNLRVPRMLGEREMTLRKYLSSKLVRGSVLCLVNIERNVLSSDQVAINKELAHIYFNEMKQLADELNTNDSDILRTIFTLPDVIKTEEGGLTDADWKDVLGCCDDALAKFEKFRTDEGKALEEMLRDHNNLILKTYLPEIEKHEVDRKQALREKLIQGLQDLSAEVSHDSNRLEQEMIYYLEKLDVTEEKNRLMAHCLLFDKELNGSSNGKKLGFVSQEMGREINTLGSKANYSPMQEVVIGMKEELEKIKEQTLNVL
ncbi:MAG: hypothetical protein ACI9NN_001226 [Bacteroidia bacterium]|jgi:uncharacterized protein (TIGR00255 family)